MAVFLAVLARLQHRTGAVGARDRQLPVVGLVRVARHDGVDVGVHSIHDLAEGRVAGGARERGVRRALVHRQHNDIRFTIGRVAVAELVGHAIDLGRDVAELEVRNPRRTHERGGLIRRRSNEPDGHAAGLLERVLGEFGLAGRYVINVRAEQRIVGGRNDSALEIGLAAVELVIADRTRIDADRVEGVDGGLVLLDEARECGGPD